MSVCIRAGSSQRSSPEPDPLLADNNLTGEKYGILFC